MGWEVSSLLRGINTFTIKSGIWVGHLNTILAPVWGREFEQTNLQNFKCPRGGGRVDASNWSAYNTGFILGHLWINLVLDLMILKNQSFIYRHYSNYKEKWGKPNAVTLPGDSLCLKAVTRFTRSSLRTSVKSFSRLPKLSSPKRPCCIIFENKSLGLLHFSRCPEGMDSFSRNFKPCNWSSSISWDSRSKNLRNLFSMIPPLTTTRESPWAMSASHQPSKAVWMLPSSSFQVHVMLQIHESTKLPSPFAEGVVTYFAWQR